MQSLFKLRSLLVATMALAVMATPLPFAQAQAPRVPQPRLPEPPIEEPPPDFEPPLEFAEPTLGGRMSPKTPALFQSKPASISPQDSAEMRLMKERYNAAVEEVTGFYGLFLNGQASLDAVCDAASRAGKAKLELTSGDARQTVHQEIIEVARALESNAKLRWESGTLGSAYYHQAVYFRADAELQALRDQQRPSSGSSVAAPVTTICVPRVRRFGR